MGELRGKALILGHLAMILACLIILAPFAWIAVNSAKRQIDIYEGTLQFTPTWLNYDRLLFSKQSNFIRNLANSAIVATASTLVVMAVGTLTAYGLTRYVWGRRFRLGGWFKGALLGWILLFHMIPAITLVGPWYLIFRELGLYNNLLGLLLTHITLNLPMAT